MLGEEWQVWSFDQVAAVLGAIGMSAARDEEVDRAALGRELGLTPVHLDELLDYVDRTGLAWIAPVDEPEVPSFLTRAGSQYLDMKGAVSAEVLHFLPIVIEDLHARRALIDSGGFLVDEFRAAILDGRAVEHAADLVPDAFVAAIDEALALNLFAAAVALMARLSSGDAAGCLAEEILAVALLNEAEAWLEHQIDKGELKRDEAQAATDDLRGIFELFEDDDVLALFEMKEPADAALAGHSSINRQIGVADQRVEAWFRPFGGVTATGYLDERRA
jgi:hypothetical protein